MFALDPEKAVSVVRFRPRFYETDLMGIVHHANYLKYYELGRVEWLRRRGSTFADWQARGHNFPVVDAQVSYKKPCRFDDDLALRLELVQLRSHSLKWTYTLTCGDELRTTGETRLACIDNQGKLLRFDEAMIAMLTSGEDPELVRDR